MRGRERERQRQWKMRRGGVGVVGLEAQGEDMEIVDIKDESGSSESQPDSTEAPEESSESHGSQPEEPEEAMQGSESCGSQPNSTEEHEESNQTKDSSQPPHSDTQSMSGTSAAPLGTRPFSDEHTQCVRLNSCIQAAASRLQDFSQNNQSAAERVRLLIQVIPRKPTFPLGKLLLLLYPLFSFPIYT